MARKPQTLEEAIDYLVRGLSMEEREEIKNSLAASHHHTVGRWIRNNWGLWDPASPLSLHFLDRFDLTHADDMSGIILSGVKAKVMERAFDPQHHANHYHAYWESMARQAGSTTPVWP